MNILTLSASQTIKIIQDGYRSTYDDQYLVVIEGSEEDPEPGETHITSSHMTLYQKLMGKRHPDDKQTLLEIYIDNYISDVGIENGKVSEIFTISSTGDNTVRITDEPYYYIFATSTDANNFIQWLTTETNKVLSKYRS